MNRYRSYGAQDDQPQVAGDQAFLGVNEYDTPQNLQPGEVQKAVNVDFRNQAAETRGGFVCLPELGKEPFGTTWTGVTAYPAITWNAVAFGNGLYVAVGYDASEVGAVMTSPDAITWTQQIIVNAPKFSDIQFAEGKFIAVGLHNASTSFGVRSSTDGITWSTVTLPAEIDSMVSVTYGNGTWALLGQDYFGGFYWYAYKSVNNGVTWTRVLITQHNAGNDGYIMYGNGIFVVTLPYLIQIYYSTNLTSWAFSYIQDPDPIGLLTREIAFNGTLFAIIANNGSIYTSPNGINWTRVRNKDVPLYDDVWFAGVGSPEGFIAVGANGYGILSSLNGSQWVRTSTIPSGTYNGAVYNEGCFVIVGAAGKVAYSSSPIISVFGSSVYSDPNEIGVLWIMMLGSSSVGFYAGQHTKRTISLGTHTIAVNTQATILQANNYVYIFRGDNAKPLYWDGNWNGTFAEVPDTGLPSSFNSIPNSNQATYYQNRLWVRDGKDSIAASDVLAFTDYDPLANEFNLNTGNSDYVVATFPFGQNSLVAFKNKSILLLQNVEGSLSDVTVTEVTRQVGLIGINAVASIGPDLAYVSNRNINLLTLTSTNNSLQHKILPLSSRIRKIMDRVNWEVGYKISMGYWNNKLYVALPIDNSLFCNCVVVHNFITDRWYGEWSFSSTMNMCIQGWQVIDYLGLQRLHAITEDGRIFVTDEGQNDISGTTLAEISTELVTRAYMTQNLNHFQRRMFMDIATNRPDLSVSVYTDGASEESVLITDQTYSRSESWLFNDSSYDLTNVNDDFNRAYRKDYSTGPSSVQPGTGFQPEMLQEQRLPLISRRQGRLSWIKLTNTQGLLTARTLGYETRPGQRANLTQV
jgi:hypothetical protein